MGTAGTIGVPIKILHEAEGHVITLETMTGEVYRGKLIEAEDNMNAQMCDITVTYRDGRVAQLEHVFIRGSKIRFMILPDMLKNAPMFKNIGKTPKGLGGIIICGPMRGRAGAFRRGIRGGRGGFRPRGDRGGRGFDGGRGFGGGGRGFGGPPGMGGM